MFVTCWLLWKVKLLFGIYNGLWHEMEQSKLKTLLLKCSPIKNSYECTALKAGERSLKGLNNYLQCLGSTGMCYIIQPLYSSLFSSYAVHNPNQISDSQVNRLKPQRLCELKLFPFLSPTISLGSS